MVSIAKTCDFFPPPIWLVGTSSAKLNIFLFRITHWPSSAAPPSDPTSETHLLTHNLLPTLNPTQMPVSDVATLADPLRFLSCTSLHFNCHLLFFCFFYCFFCFFCFCVNLFHRADSAFDGCVACKPCCFNSPPRCKNNKRKKKLIFPPLTASAAYCRPFCLLPSPLPCWALFYRDCQASWDIECHCGCLIVTARAGCRGVNTTAVLYFFFLHVLFLNNIFHWRCHWTENSMCFVDIFPSGWTL